jgi:XTP/dITP diphosphohydrolase
MKKRQLVLATQNQDKVKELSSILDSDRWELKSLQDFAPDEEIEENGTTLMENALIKARAAFRISACPSVADDTGLEVDGLNGAPGVRSSRFAHDKATYDENVQKLIHDLEGVPEEKRTASFRCVAAYVDGSQEKSFEGVINGRILDQTRGSHGFGYDPVFYVPEVQKTFAEMDSEEKNRISHRGLAFRKMAEFLENL